MNVDEGCVRWTETGNILSVYLDDGLKGTELGSPYVL